MSARKVINQRDPLELYKKYHIQRNDERIGLFIELSKKYKILNVLYMGCFVHIAPSIVFPSVVYVDTDKRAKRFFSAPKVIEFVNKHKIYEGSSSIIFYSVDYTTGIAQEQNASFDLLISQYAGFVSLWGKPYLKIGSIMVANDSHGDASMAYIDKDYQLVGVYNTKSDSEYTISNDRLDEYFTPKTDIRVTKDHLLEIQRGIRYKKQASGYIFERVS